MSNLSSLLDRVRKAEGPDRDLDAMILVAITPTLSTSDDLRYAMLRDSDCSPGTYWIKQRSGASLRTAPTLTSSLDACLSLLRECLPGWRWYMAMGRSRPDEPLYGASLLAPGRSADDEPDVIAEHEHGPSLALLDCILQAILSQQSEVEKT